MSYPRRKILVNGRLVPSHRAVVPVSDHGFLYGDGIYETLRVYNGHVFELAAHMRRLKASADGIGLKLPVGPAAFSAAVRRLVAANRYPEAVVRVTVTRGPGPYGFDTRPCATPTWVIDAVPFRPYPARFHERGITAAIVGVRRNNPAAQPPSVKSTSCLNGVLAKMASVRAGAEEGILLTLGGDVAEGTVSNVFAVVGGRLVTPRLEGDLLPGVTRAHVARLARKIGVRLSEARLTPADLWRASEIFVTNTTLEVVPVRRLIDASGGRRRARAVGSARPGPVTRRLMGAFSASLRPLYAMGKIAKLRVL